MTVYVLLQISYWRILYILLAVVLYCHVYSVHTHSIVFWCHLVFKTEIKTYCFTYCKIKPTLYIYELTSSLYFWLFLPQWLGYLIAGDRLSCTWQIYLSVGFSPVDLVHILICRAICATSFSIRPIVFRNICIY